MKPPQFSDTQKASILKQGTEGMPVAEICCMASSAEWRFPDIFAFFSPKKLLSIGPCLNG